MANAASRIFNIIKNTSEETNIKPSEIVTLTVKSINPIIFQRDDRLEIADNFCIYNKSVNKAALQINDKVTAIVLSNGQQYYIAEDNKETPTEPTNYNDLSNKPKINGVELSGNKTSEDLGIETIDVIDNLESTDTDSALSANQGRILAEIIDDTDTKVNNVVGVDAYDNTATYNVGDFCIYNNILYRCKTKITTPEAFNSAKWDAKTVEEYIKDTGWITATLTTNFKAYDDNVYNMPRYRKIGKIVEINGMVSPKTAVSGSQTIFNLPSGYRPVGFNRYYLCQGSGGNKWLLNIATNGNVTCDRYGTTSGGDFPASIWMPFTAVFMTD